MSGGVDSSVSAALLKDQGFDVTGVFIKAWEPEGFDCGWREERRDAMRVAAQLNIPFITLDLSKEYKEAVVDYMIAEYKVGRTPNPDVMCNKAIKFGAFFKKAMAEGADFVATGHYARSARIADQRGRDADKRGRNSVDSNPQFFIPECQATSSVVIPAHAGIQAQDPEFQMLAGVDQNKDQSYFLWSLTQDHLAHTLFPVGDMEKPEVRKLAEKFNLPTKAKKDSQGICFVGKLDLKDFLKEFIEQKDGDVLDTKGKIIGSHHGVLFFTLGERHGFEIFKKTSNEEPLYVIAKDLKANTITVFNKPFNGSNDKEITINSINWISGKVPDLTKTYQARIRYRQPLQSCRIAQSSSEGEFLVTFDNPQPSISPGQSLVIYDGEICLGGGVIK